MLIKTPLIKSNSSKTIRSILPQYELLDSGNQVRVERFGKHIIVRPYKRALWSLAQASVSEWQSRASAHFSPGNGWQTSPGPLDPWELETSFGPMLLRLQQSNQLGIFPEHASYCSLLAESLLESEDKSVLSLFAYTGLAGLYLRSQGAEEVLHVDSSKKALDWAQENSKRIFSDPRTRSVRLIREDALTYLKRCQKRNTSFSIVIADPPAFSRSKKAKDAWQLEEKIVEICDALVSVTSKGGLCLVSCHSLGIDQFCLGNILRASAAAQKRAVNAYTEECLTIQETNKASRTISLGYFAAAKLG